MTVADLIEILKTMPQDATVLACDPYGEYQLLEKECVAFDPEDGWWTRDHKKCNGPAVSIAGS